MILDDSENSTPPTGAARFISRDGPGTQIAPELYTPSPHLPTPGRKRIQGEITTGRTEGENSLTELSHGRVEELSQMQKQILRVKEAKGSL